MLVPCLGVAGPVRAVSQQITPDKSDCPTGDHSLVSGCNMHDRKSMLEWHISHKKRNLFPICRIPRRIQLNLCGRVSKFEAILTIMKFPLHASRTVLVKRSFEANAQDETTLWKRYFADTFLCILKLNIFTFAFDAHTNFPLKGKGKFCTTSSGKSILRNI